MNRPEREINVATPRDEVVSANARGELPKNLLGGTVAMQKAGKKYINKTPGESESVWQERVDAAVLLNIYKRTVSMLVGQVFSREASLAMSEDVALPELFSAMAEDVDLQGNSLSVWAARFFEDSMNCGGGVLLVDFPQIATRTAQDGSFEYQDVEGVWRKKTAQADAENGWRPYFVHISQRDLLGWRFKSVNGRRVLAQLRFVERVTESVGDWDVQDKSVEQVRVLEPGKWEVWRKKAQEGGREEWVLDTSGTTSLKAIPAVPLLLGEKCGEMCAYPALEDMAHLNRRHWQSTVDQYDLIAWMRRPVWLGVALQTEDGLVPHWGPGTILNSPTVGAALQSVSVAPEAVAKGQEDLDKLETQMSMFGMRLLMPRNGQVTATQNTLESAENDSTLKRWAMSLKDCLEQALMFAAQWMNVEGSQVPSATVNTEFHLLDGMTVAEIKEAVTLGIVSKRMAFDELKRRGLVPDDADWAETQAEMENEARQSQGPSLGAGLAANLLGGAS